jgi:2-alkenal reductase
MWQLHKATARSLAVLAMVAAFGFGSVTQSVAQEALADSMTPVEVVRTVGPAVVTVINEQAIPAMSALNGSATSTEGQIAPAGSGSGFVIDEAGHIVTNNHVVAGGAEFAVILADGTVRQNARLIGADPVSDLAVIQVVGDLPPAVAWGDSSLLQPGETVLAMGSPLGALSNSVTEGIVGGLGRSLPPQPGGPDYNNLIQHDAPINPGNSGGPLFDLHGQVVGINTIGIPEAEQGVPAQGLFFAIPANAAQRIVTQLISTGQVVYPSLGIEDPVQLDNTIAEFNNLPVSQGILVSGVEAGGPAERAGIKAGDIILAVDGQAIDAMHPLDDLLLMHEPGDRIELSIQGDSRSQVAVTLEARAPEMACQGNDCGAETE